MKLQMKMLMVGMVLMALTTTGRAQTYQVYPVRFGLSGAIEFLDTNKIVKDSGITNQLVHPIVMKSADLVNLARGRNLRTAVPTNEVLALASVCGTNLSKLIVFDPNTSSNLATIAQFDLLSESIGYKAKGSTNTTVTITTNTESTLVVTIPGAGSATNALTGGFLLLNARSVLTTNGCIQSWNGTMLGALGTIVTDDNGVASNITVQVRKATLSATGKAVGTLVESE